MITIISDFQDYSSKMISKWSESEIKFYCVKDTIIQYCKGCFGCWIRTPGQCVLPDTDKRLTDQMISSELVILVSQIVYGSYSPEIKRYIDRSIPNVLPTFSTINNETHHKKRYRQYPDLKVVGYSDSLTKNEAATFRKLVQAHGINFHSQNTESTILNTTLDIDDAITAFVRGIV